MFAPELFLELRKLLEYLPGRLAFEILGHLGDGNLGWHRNKNMDVVFRDVTTDNLYLVIFTDFSDEITSTSPDASRQNGLMVLGGPN